MIEIETPLGKLHNKEAIKIHAILDSVPPIAPSESYTGVNTFKAVNVLVPLYNDQDEAVAFFAGHIDRGDGDSAPCLVRMISGTSTMPAEDQPTPFDR